MSIETWIRKDMFIYGQPLRNKQELKRSIKECEETIKQVREKIKSYVFMTEPQKFFPNEDDIMFYLDREFEELMEEYDRAQINLTRLWEFEESWDETHDEQDRSILPVNPLDMKKSYMGGDYAESILEDGDEVPEDYWDVYHGHIKLEDCSFRHKFGYPPAPPKEELPEMTLEEVNEYMKNKLKEYGD